MADYWVSTKRWTCKYCDITINDDAPSRRQHEEGLRHKNNVQRALRDVYKRQEKEAREKEEAKREMSRIERLAAEAHRSDIASGASPPGPSPSTTASTSTSRSPPAPTSSSQRWAPSNKLSAYGSLAADEEALRWQREAEAAEQARVQQEEERRERAAIPGDWEEVTHAPVATASSSNINVAPHAALGERSEARSFRFKERKAASDDEEEDGQAAVIKVKKRERAPDTDAGRLERERLEERARLRPEYWSGGLRLAAPGASAVRSSSERDGEREEVVVAPVKQEGDADEEEIKVAVTAPPSVETSEPADEASTAAAATSASPPPAAPTSNPFRKRKAGAGAGSKKVRLA